MSSPAAGWFPDPSNPQAQRYWDGNAWSQQTQPMPQSMPQSYPAAPGYPPASSAYPQAPPQGMGSPYGTGSPYGMGTPFAMGSSSPSGSASLVQRNQIAAITVGVCVLYVVLAFFAHFVFIGVLPVILTIRSFRRREPLAAVALAATVISVAISLFALAN